MTTLSSEELQAQRSDFGLRLSNSMAKYGPLCVGIDPHAALLAEGESVDLAGGELGAAASRSDFTIPAACDVLPLASSVEK